MKANSNNRILPKQIRKLEAKGQSGGSANRHIESVRIRVCVVLVLTGLLITDRREARAVEVHADVLAESVFGAPGVFNPRAPYGLLAVATESVVYSYDCPFYSLQASADAAAYGSDSWRDEAGIPALLLDLAVEPMADARAYAFSTSTRESSGDAFASSEAEILVHHRVIARAFPPELEPVLESLTLIPVKFHFKIHVSVKGPAGQHLKGRAYGYIHLYTPDQPVFTWWTNLSVYTDEGPPTTEMTKTLALNLRRYRTNDVHTYWITAKAHAEARSFNGLAGEAQAVTDPLLEVDPDWEYAPYFTVVQESIRHPGEWIEITREWESVVLPPTLALTLTNSAPKLAWPAAAGEFALQSATNLSPPVAWSAVTNPPVLTTNGQWQVAPSATAPGPRFYRLESR